MKRVVFILALLVAVVFVLSKCGSDQPTLYSESPKYLNLHDTVKYVGIETCRSCHGDIYESFIHTGMGQSFGPADTAKSIAHLADTTRLYDAHLNLYYHPFWQQDSLFLKEYRLHEGDTVYSQERLINYVIGSGQHTNSHLVNVGGYVFQAPFTWYAQKGRLDLPPGFEDGANSRFSRPIGLECMSCHNAMPKDFVKGSINKFEKVDWGINCERCHGPGEAHLKKMQAGDITDTSRFIDPSIVNPAKLPTDLQFELCQRCHLQGNAVLKPGKSFFDFKPGMRLNEVMEVYLPKYSNAEDQFIMASHVDRFKQSACFIQSDKGFNCISCHNPHKSVKVTDSKIYNRQCKNCHGSAAPFSCTEDEKRLEAADFNCVQCHMPPSTATDIPHVTVHDHYIRKAPKTKAQQLAESEFLGLFAINQSSPSARSKALAYLQHYERFNGSALHLDSAAIFLERLSRQHPEHLFLYSYYYHLRGDAQGLLQYVQSRGGIAVLRQLDSTSLNNKDAWTAYRIGEAYFTQEKNEIASLFYQQATALAPFVLDFRYKLGVVYSAIGQTDSAQKQYRNVLKELPLHKEALNNLAFLELENGRYARADSLLNKALQLYPDYELAWLNRARLRIEQKRLAEARHALKEVLRINKQNQQARKVLTRIESDI